MWARTRPNPNVLNVFILHSNLHNNLMQVSFSYLTLIILTKGNKFLKKNSSHDLLTIFFSNFESIIIHLR